MKCGILPHAIPFGMEANKDQIIWRTLSESITAKSIRSNAIRRKRESIAEDIG